MSHEAHNEAVHIAIAEMQAVGHRLIAAREKLAEALSAIVVAVGDPPRTEAGRNALHFAATLENDVDAGYRTCENIEAELLRYLGGF